MALSGWHIWLHFGKSNWFTRFHRQKSRLTRILWWATLATLASGIIATAHSLGSFTHGHIGGVHGKLGFLMIILSGMVVGALFSALVSLVKYAPQNHLCHNTRPRQMTSN